MCEGLLAAIPLFVLAVTLARTWLDPMAVDGGRYVSLGVGIMVLEFIFVHSGAFMSAYTIKDDHQVQTLGDKLKPLLGFLVLYSLFAAGIIAAFKSYELLILYGCVMVGRTAGIITRPDHQKHDAVARSSISAALYLLVVTVTLFLPLPELGITHSVLAEVYPDRGSGEWERHPQIALAAGTAYFTALGLFELYLIKRHWSGDPPLISETA